MLFDKVFGFGVLLLVVINFSDFLVDCMVFFDELWVNVGWWFLCIFGVVIVLLFDKILTFSFLFSGAEDFFDFVFVVTIV